MAGGAKTAGGAIPLPWGLPFSGPLAEPLKVTPGEFLDEPFGGSRGRRWPVGGKVIFTFKGTFISTFALNSIGHTCGSIFPFGVRTTAGTIRGRGRRSNRSSVVRKLGHVSRVAT